MGGRIGIGVTGAGHRFTEAADQLADYERSGAEVVFVPELYGFDGVSRPRCWP